MSYDKYLFLDVGDTILHLKKSAGETYFEILVEAGFKKEKNAQEFYRKAFLESWHKMHENSPPEHRDKYQFHPGGTQGWWKELLADFLERIPDRVSLEKAFPIIYNKFADPELWTVDPGFWKLKNYCKNENWGLGVISNWDHRLRALLEAKEISEYLNPIIVSAEFGYEKPSPKIFEEAMRLVRLSGDCLVYCGDKYELDVVVPRSLGWRSYLKNKKGDLESLSELIRFL
ncbi:HAD-IA family hydrolase [Leptospira mayottensis]|uniref:HAD hydrolase, REG-2-like, family IA n=2 Tax=Leptospira mayottensis TaxID=1137606 RepID=A0AA87SUN1_9LEPT|nr:HAD-IA family hydrolase [Leptospira mayottensis]AXR59544.1 HAD family hydrolase [Leptospira mayottensis]AXR63330.1 HAD family hydrolase [Leptospira mayottensis]AXR67095.1 HAD family hydrolase [Leptospira mayottensis]AZQ01136.1 hydrolase [Leptospira mayottensis 200901116]EKR98229.1 HAD hydrolase, REG-2-like, family IA [Leptospira mayottensis 200901122]